jgi:hypothetical protein
MCRFVSSSILALALSSPVFAVTSQTDLGVAGGSLYNSPEDSNTETATTQRVRIPLTLKTWNDVETRATDGSSRKSRIAGKAVAQVLRARIERANDFYLGDWRVQTTPVRWLKRSNQYQVRLEVFRRHGDAGQLEESLGSVTLTGVLDKQDDGLFMVHGTARRIFRDKSGEPVLDMEAGMHPQDEERGTAISRR